MTRIDISDLPLRARESLERGEAVEIVRAGEVVARVPAAPPASPSLLDGLAAFAEWRKANGISDEEWLASLEEWRVELKQLRALDNRPVTRLDSEPHDIS